MEFKDKLAESGITPEQAEAAGLFFTANASTISPEFKSAPAIVIPYYAPDGETIVALPGEKLFCRVRYLEHIAINSAFGKPKALRYSQPAASGCHAYFPRLQTRTWSDVLSDQTTPLIITEGEFKALKACIEGFYCIGLGGVFNFMKEGELLPEIAAANLNGRNVFICFDSDAATNPDIQAAEGRLIEQLSKRGATLYLARLLPKGDGGKVGLDDLLVEFGAEMLDSYLRNSHRCGELEAAVYKLNEQLAIVEGEGKIYEMETKLWKARTDFTEMSKWSSLKVNVPKGPKAGAGRGNKGPAQQFKEIALAPEWLKHEHARRYDEALFRPEFDDLSVPGESGGTALNLWRGWEGVKHGDISIFREFYDYLFGSLAGDVKEFVWRLMAYKVQNPGRKLPFGIVLVGETQGVGKSFFAEILADMVAPYGANMTSKQLIADFRGWLETALVVVVNEADSVHMRRGAEELKTLVADQRQLMNDKYRRARQVNTYCTFILTANNHAVASFPDEDRKFFVVSMPRQKQPKEFYDRLRAWRDAGGPKMLLGYWLNYDLKSWQPPAAAPLTPEKSFAAREGTSIIGALAHKMLHGGTHAVVDWLNSAKEWAEAQLIVNQGDQAAMGALSAISAWRIRPFYTAEELLTMFPDVRAQLFSNRDNPQTLAGAFSQQLRNHGIPPLLNKDREDGCFLFQGRLQQFLIISDQNEWCGGVDQATFDGVIQNATPYAVAALARSRA